MICQWRHRMAVDGNALFCRVRGFRAPPFWLDPEPGLPRNAAREVERGDPRRPTASHPGSGGSLHARDAGCWGNGWAGMRRGMLRGRNAPVLLAIAPAVELGSAGVSSRSYITTCPVSSLAWIIDCGIIANATRQHRLAHHG